MPRPSYKISPFGNYGKVRNSQRFSCSSRNGQESKINSRETWRRQKPKQEVKPSAIPSQIPPLPFLSGDLTVDKRLLWDVKTREETAQPVL